MFYNTTNEVNPDLGKSKVNAETKEQHILKFFEAVSKIEEIKWMTVYEVHKATEFHPSTVARSITDLTTNGKLIMSKEANYMGGYGKKVHAWKFNG